jgi:hypothetical protein
MCTQKQMRKETEVEGEKAMWEIDEQNEAAGDQLILGIVYRKYHYVKGPD